MHVDFEGGCKRVDDIINGVVVSGGYGASVVEKTKKKTNKSTMKFQI